MEVPIIGGGPPLIEGDDQKRAKKCNQELNAILKKYDCIIVPQFVITGVNLTTGWLVGPLPREPNGKRKRLFPFGHKNN